MKIIETTVPIERTFTLEVNEDELKYILYMAQCHSGTGSVKLATVIRKLLISGQHLFNLDKCFNE